MTNQPSVTAGPGARQVSDPQFRLDLYQGTAADYDRFRVPYPRSVTDELASRCGADGTGRMLDLACGTGFLAFALHNRFARVLAVDAEPGMVSLVSEKARAAGIGSIRCQAAVAENLPMQSQLFNLIVIGNAFHRLRRQAVAAETFRCLRPGGYLALVWSAAPWHGDAPWQQALSRVMGRWMTMTRAGSRLPDGHEQARQERPDPVILTAAGFEPAGGFNCQFDYIWTPLTLAGFMLSTSVLSRVALGGTAEAFEADLARELLAADPAGEFRQAISFACELARRPASAAGRDSGQV